MYNKHQLYNKQQVYKKPHVEFHNIPTVCIKFGLFFLKRHLLFFPNLLMFRKEYLPLWRAYLYRVLAQDILIAHFPLESPPRLKKASYS